MVFEAGLRAVPLSIDLWIHYINYTLTRLAQDPDREALIRRLFERAIAAAGTDFRSDKLWDMFVNWEKENKLLQNVTELYDRVLTIPTQLYSHHWDDLSAHIKGHHPKDILRLDEFLKLRKEVIALRETTVKEEDEDEADGGPPGDAVEAPPGLDAMPPGTDMAAKTQLVDTEVPLLRDKILELRQAVHRQTEQEVSKRWTFEEGIRRPYFHVKPLEKVQLKNWRDYLNYEVENGSHERVVVLFERCMIACALYEDFWIKYATYMEPHSVEGVRNVYKRACTIHLRKKPAIHIAWAAFEERQGNVSGALDILKNLEEMVPGLAMVSLRRISMERRHGNFEAMEGLYQRYMSEAESTEVRSFYAVKYARYLAKILGNSDKARTVLQEALEKDEANPKLLLQLVDLEYQQSPVSEVAMTAAFERAIHSEMALEHRVAFSQRQLEFLEDFGSSVARIMEAYEEHQKLLKEMQASRKRKSEEQSEPASKKTKSEEVVANGGGDVSSAAPTTTSHTPAVATAPTTHYHTDPQASAHYNYQHSWPAYSGYGGYQHPGWGGYGYYGSQ